MTRRRHDPVAHPPSAPFGLELTASLVPLLRAAADLASLELLLDDLTREMGFRHFALAHHAALSRPAPGQVLLTRYPEAILDDLATADRWRRDPVVRGCCFSPGAFMWSELPALLRLTRHDRAILARGATEGLDEGITVPYALLGECLGSCTFAGTNRPDAAARYLGAAQVIGIFAFHAARRLVGGRPEPPRPPPRLHPRHRDCVVLAGRGCSNKQIARALSLTPRTVDGYLTDARRLFAAHDRTELVIGAVLAGEVGLDELRRQPE